MPQVKTESLKEEMVVTRDVKNIDNMLLIPSGTTLTERHINILQAWGVAEIEVKDSPAGDAANDPLAKLSPEELAKLTDEVKARFWKPDETNPIFTEVFNIILRRRALHSGPA
jgi:hypothetical protein